MAYNLLRTPIAARRLFSTAVATSAHTSAVLGKFRSPTYPGYAVDPRTLKLNATQLSSLGNGLRVATQHAAGDMAAVGVFIDAGSRDEAAGKNGVAHFLEHLMFKGTANRSKDTIEREIEAKGAHLNAYTSREHTCYVARVLKKDVPWAMEFLGDILLKSNYDSNAVNAERGTILREMDEVNKDMREVIFDNLHATAYHGQALGNTILGPVDNINSIVRDDLANFVKANYTAPRMNAIVVGDVDHAQAAELANKHFGSVSAKPLAPVQARVQARYIGSDIRERNDDTNDIHFAIGFESFGAKNADSVALMVMQTLLGEWHAASSVGSCSSSELCRTVAENGLATQVSAFSTQYSDTGLFGVYGVGHQDHITDLIWATQRCILNLAHTVSDEDVARANSMLKATILSSSEGTNATCEEIGRQLVGFGRHLSLAEMFARIDQVDANTVRRVAGEIINDRDHVCSSHGPVGFSGPDSMPDYTWMRRRNFMLRY